MKSLLIMGLLIVSLAQAKDDSKVTYGGLGHYYCTGNTAECALVNQNNRAYDDREAMKREREKLKAEDYERETRRIEQENRNGR